MLFFLKSSNVINSFMHKQKFEIYTKDLYLKKIHTGSIWTEGHCYLKKLNKVVWSDIPNNRMLSFDFKKVEIFRSPSNFSNGNTVDNKGNLVTCEHGARRVTTTDDNNVITLIADEYNNKRLNSPNDVCVHSNGTIFFTDPPYGIINSNTGDKKYLRRYDIDKNLKIINPVVFAETDPDYIFDGFRFDVDNNIWTSCGDGVACYNPSGEQIGYIKIPERVSNVDFGGMDGKTLFITASTSFYMANLNIMGARFK